MKLIKPFYEILTPINKEEIFKTIEKVARTCYKSEDKITETSAEEMIKSLIKRGHEAMLEFFDITVKFTCDRGVSHELVRHRIASFAQESTRYCNYSKDKFDNQVTFIIPEWTSFKEGTYTSALSIPFDKEEFKGEVNWFIHMIHSETIYNELIKDGWQPQQARAVLPNSLKTEINVKMNLREWRHFFKLRTAVVAHPQMRELTRPLLDEMKIKLPILFDDITYD
ncbi:MAG: FAD-dependent thymidylate synthase [Candidatus Nanoarchaeia archaeon]|nr:FAD-dependent thymidylate synthase [Candidatus Nanoarchaeia archaeon]